MARPGATSRDTAQVRSYIKMELINSSDLGGWSGQGSIDEKMNNKPQHILWCCKILVSIAILRHSCTPS